MRGDMVVFIIIIASIGSSFFFVPKTVIWSCALSQSGLRSCVFLLQA